MRINRPQLFAKPSYPSSETESMKTLSLRKKLCFVAGSVVGKLNGAGMEGLCGPGIYCGAAMAEVISGKDSKVDLVEGVTCAGQPVVNTVAQPSA